MKILYITCKDKEEARAIGKALVSEKIAVCANIFPIESLYLWKGEFTEDNEVVLLLKVLDEKVEEARKLVEEKHSYDIPFIGVLSVDVNEAYRKWAEEK